MPRLCEFYAGIYLTTEEKAWKNLTQCKKNLSQVKKNLKVQKAYYQKHPHITKPSQKHITKPTHTPTRAHTLRNNTYTQIECILDMIDEYRWNWLLHLQRMPLNRIPLKSYHYRPKGRRTIGRPKKRWREQL